MGYYKDIDTLSQAKIDQTVRWWREHHGVVPDYLCNMVIADDVLFERVVAEWETATYGPTTFGFTIPASTGPLPNGKRVSRKESQALIRQHKREALWTMTWQESRLVTVTMMIALTGMIGLLIAVVAVTS
jgi:hypothetical protein